MQINEQALIDAGKYLGINPKQIAIEMRNAPYAEKTLGGHPYPSGTGRTSERAFLYALVRLFKPKTVLEIGTGWGATTLQLLSAIEANRNGAHVVSLDIVKQRWGRDVGSLIHHGIRDNLLLITESGIPYLKRGGRADFILEDGSHTYDETRAVWASAIPLLPNNGIMISHDATNKPDVLRAIQDCGIYPVVLQLEDRAPGFALWQKKPAQVAVPKHNESIDTVIAKTEAPATRASSRRKRRASKA